MRTCRRSFMLTAVSLTALAAATSSASAGGFGIREQSATAQGVSFAGAASGSGGLSSMFWNPATITMAPGWQSENHLSFIIPESKITPVAGTSPLLLPLGPSGDIGLDAAVVAGYNSYQVNDRLWVGLSAGAPFGLATKPNFTSAGQPYARTARIVSFNVNPVIGFKVNEWLSIAAGPTFQYFDLKSRRASGFAPTSPNITVEGDDIGVGFTAGVTLTPFAGTSLGVGFRSSVHHRLEGNLLTPVSVTPVSANVNTPETVTVGLSQQVTQDLRLHAGFEWTNWSRLKTPAIVGPAGPIAGFPLNYKDGYFYSVGAEYQFLPQWVVRAGVAYEDSPITEAVRSPRLPDNDRIWLSLGASYQWSDKLSFDLAYSHIFVRNTRIRIVQGQQDFIADPRLPGGGLPLVADVDSRVDIVSVGMKYRWDNPARPIPAAIVAKN